MSKETKRCVVNSWHTKYFQIRSQHIHIGQLFLSTSTLTERLPKHFFLRTVSWAWFFILLWWNLSWRKEFRWRQETSFTPWSRSSLLQERSSNIKSTIRLAGATSVLYTALHTAITRWFPMRSSKISIVKKSHAWTPTVKCHTIQYNTITLFKEGRAITFYSFLTYGPKKNR